LKTKLWFVTVVSKYTSYIKFLKKFVSINTNVDRTQFSKNNIRNQFSRDDINNTVEARKRDAVQCLLWLAYWAKTELPWGQIHHIYMFTCTDTARRETDG